MRRWAPATVRAELFALAALFMASIMWKIGVATLLEVDSTGWTAARVALPACIDQFVYGMVLAVLVAGGAEGSGGRTGFVMRLVRRRPWLPLLMAAALFPLLAIHQGAPGDSPYNFLLQHQLRAIVGLLVLTPAVIGAHKVDFVRRVLGMRTLLWLGLVSYSFYLWHYMFIQRFDELAALHDAGLLAVAIPSLLATLLVSWLSYRLLEKPGIALGRRLSARS
jgi:peptidoglycan/LPS O-acetylase OafA/YrhL